MNPRAWSVSRARLEDKEAILEIERECATAPHWSEAAWLKILADRSASGTERVSFVAWNGNQLLGFVVVRCSIGIAELESVAVAPSWRRRGLGRALCEEAMRWSRDSSATIVELEVRASDAGALALYRSLGFIEQGRRRNYYRNPTEDARLLCAPL